LTGRWVWSYYFRTVKPRSKRKIFINFILFFIILFYVLGLFIYKKPEEKFSFDIFTNHNSEEKLDEGKEKIVDKSLQSLPEDFPVYKNSKLINSWSVEDKKSAISVVWESSDSVEIVTDFYNAEFKKNGWDITSSILTEESSIFSFEKQGSKGFLGILEENNSIVISATIEFSK